MVTNDFPQITHDLFFEWREHHRPDAPDLWPADLREEMETVMKRVFTEVNNGVYRCGFAGSQEAYDDAYDRLWVAMDWLEERLTDRRYLMGDAITEADVRLFTTLARFDAVYHGHFKCNRVKLTEMPALWGYARDLFQTPGFGETIDFDQIKQHYYVVHTDVNPTGIVPAGSRPGRLAGAARARLTGHPAVTGSRRPGTCAGRRAGTSCRRRASCHGCECQEVPGRRSEVQEVPGRRSGCGVVGSARVVGGRRSVGVVGAASESAWGGVGRRRSASGSASASGSGSAVARRGRHRPLHERRDRRAVLRPRQPDGVQGALADVLVVLVALVRLVAGQVGALADPAVEEHPVGRGVGLGARSRRRPARTRRCCGG